MALASDKRAVAGKPTQPHADACLLELRDRIQQLEAAQYTLLRCKADGLEPTEAGVRYAMQMRFPGSWQPIGGTTTYSESCNEVAAASPEVRQPPPPAADRILALQDQVRDGALSLADALKEINSEPAPGQPFTAKYLFTAGNIQQDSFYYAEWDSNSVLFDIANLGMGDGCLTPGDNIKIAHRWGEPPASGVYSTINYKIASVSETEGRAWTIRAARVSSAPDPTVRTMLPSGLPAISDPITRNPLKSDVHADFTGPQTGIKESLATPLPLTLVDRVAKSINPLIPTARFADTFNAETEARAAIREVAAWLQENPGPNSAWRAVARDLMDGANR